MMNLLWGILGSKPPCCSFPFLLCLSENGACFWPSRHLAAGYFTSCRFPAAACWKVALAGEKYKDNFSWGCNRPSHQGPGLVAGTQNERALILIHGVNWGFKSLCLTFFSLLTEPDILPCSREALRPAAVPSPAAYLKCGLPPAMELSTASWLSSWLQTLHSPKLQFLLSALTPPRPSTVTMHTPEWQLPQ